MSRRRNPRCGTVAEHVVRRGFALVATLALAVVVNLGIDPAARAANPAAKSLIEQSNAAMRGEPDRSRALAEEALAELAKQPDANLEVRAHWLLCDYHTERDRSVAQQHLEAARKRLHDTTEPALAVKLLLCEGALNELAGESARALSLFDQGVALGQTARDDETLADAFFERGYMKGLQGELAGGLADLRRAIELYARLNLSQQAANALNAVGVLYDRMGDLAQARHYFEDTLQAQRKAGQLRDQAVTHHNLGRTLQNLGDLAGARASFEAGLALSAQIAFPRGEAYTLRGLAGVSNTEGHGDAALALLDRASALLEKVPDERLRAQIALQRGVALRLQQRLPESLAALTQALKVFEAAQSRAETATTLGELAATNAALGDYRGAFEREREFKAAADRLLNEQLQQRFTMLKVEFDSAATNRENEILKRENASTERALARERRAGNWRAGILALAAVLLVVLAMLAWRHRRNSRRMQGLAMTDELTRLWNRRHVLGTLQSALANHERCALLIADIDLFKPINDEHGHVVGDHILRAVAGGLQASMPLHAELGRLGGEEFLAILPSTSYDEAMVVAEKVRGAIAALDISPWLSGRNVTISIGVTVSHAKDDLSSVLRRADAALYEAKRGGRNCVRGRSEAGDSQNAPLGAPQAVESSV